MQNLSDTATKLLDELRKDFDSKKIVMKDALLKIANRGSGVDRAIAREMARRLDEKIQ